MNVEKVKEAIILLQEHLKGIDSENNPAPEYFRNQMILSECSKELGTKEIPGKKSNPEVEAYFDEISASGNSPHRDDVPWCAAFVGAILKRSRMGHTGKLNARSYLKWGVSTKDDPQPGDIAIFWRGSRDGWKGHVAFYLKENLYVGGNQSDMVNVTRYSPDKLLDIRRSSKHIELTASHRRKLREMAAEIILGNEINLDGKVV